LDDFIPHQDVRAKQSKPTRNKGRKEYSRTTLSNHELEETAIFQTWEIAGKGIDWHQSRSTRETQGLWQEKKIFLYGQRLCRDRKEKNKKVHISARGRKNL